MAVIAVPCEDFVEVNGKMSRPASSEPQQQQQQRLEELEAKAVDKAKVTADAAFRPSPSVLNATSATVLLQSVDGVSLDTYEGKESVYVGRSVPIAAGTKMSIPIQVTTPGSVLEYLIELKSYDLSLSIAAEREEGITVVKEDQRFDYTETPTQKFLVGTVPCLIRFTFDNEFSWFREKIVSYRITVTPPSRESLAAGRRRRAKACLKAVEEDLKTASTKLQAAGQQKKTLEEEVAALTEQLAEKSKALQVAEKEETWLQERRALRLEQQRLLQQRLEHGWEDEKVLNGK